MRKIWSRLQQKNHNLIKLNAGLIKCSYRLKITLYADPSYPNEQKSFQYFFFSSFFFVYYYPGCAHTTAISCELAFSARETLPPTKLFFSFLANS